ncbi:hydrolase [Roseiconus nitratireducens]|uniref:Hydrolase n=1 Tax=Roseiconus nitratireducens TaxID=2605748 RepID=A0A5M6DP37_9BACT|nr:hydrolase [Roseiconus nitratireducens]KAA5547205.1 hydrolase [Roseiconus nitratireducens]
MTWLDRQSEPLVNRVTSLAEINSGTSNQAGVGRVAAVVRPWLETLADKVEMVELPPIQELNAQGQFQSRQFTDAVLATRRPQAPHQVLLSIHLDTVYGTEHPFQTVTHPEPNRLRGPGVADAKGGLVVMLAALEAFEQFSANSGLDVQRVGWRVVLNPDEEIGSLASVGLLQTLARDADIGMVYEPTLPDGKLIRQRKGSGNFSLLVRGRSAHAGREIERGRNAVAMLCRLFSQLQTLHRDDKSVTVNLARLIGGGPANIVPDFAAGWFNIRIADVSTADEVIQRLEKMVAEADGADGFNVSLHGGFSSLPKPFDSETRRLFDRVIEAGRTVGLSIETAQSGGVCDGNKLAAAGLTNVDTLGPRGGNIHSDQEYCLIDSLVERAKLSLAILESFANEPERFPSRESRPNLP